MDDFTRRIPLAANPDYLRQANSNWDTSTLFSLIADNIPVLVSYVDRDLHYRFVNATYERWWHVRSDQICGRHIKEALGEQIFNMVKPRIDTVLGGSTVYFETVMPFADGKTRFITTTYIPHRSDDGTVVGFFVLVTDLTERRNSEEALRSEQQFASAVLDTIGALVLVVDTEGTIIKFNRECERVTGYRSAEVEGKSYDQFLLPAERRDVWDMFRQMCDGDFPNTFENHWVAKDGTARLIAWSNTALRDGHSSVTHIIATGKDITLQRQMEAELQHSAQQLRLVTDALPVLVSYTDADMRYRFVNATYTTWFGRSKDQLLGQPVHNVIGDDAYGTLKPFAEQALAGSETVFDNVLIHQHLGPRDVNVTLIPDKGNSGNIDGYFLVAVDVTERKRLEAADRHHMMEAAHESRLITMGEMSSTIAHELNQPLTAIATTVGVCVKWATDFDRNRKEILAASLRDIRSEAQRATEIVRQIREFSRRHSPRMTRLDLQSILAQATSLVHIEARRHNVSLEINFCISCIVEADPILIEQVIVNLSRNAIEAMVTDGNLEPRLTLRADRENDTAIITVTDTGPGIPEEANTRLFEPFFTTKPTGVGLGLAICRSIVEAHNGRLWAINRPTGGTVFGFSLPITDARATQTNIP